MTDSYRQLQTVRDPLQGQPGTWDGDTKLLSGFSPETQMMTESGGLCVSKFSNQGSLRDLLNGCKPKIAYLKKYCVPSKVKTLELNDLRSLGWQILQALSFLHEKGIPYGKIF